MHILLLEDNAADRALVVRLLAKGLDTVEVTACTTLEEALAADVADLILGDMDVPDSQGLETVERLARGRAEPLIVLTGRQSDDVGPASLRTGAVDFLPKSELSASLLLRSCHHALERSRLRQGLDEAKEELRALFELNPDGLAVVDEDKVVRVVNPAATKDHDMHVGGTWTRTRPGVSDLVRGGRTTSFRCVPTRWQGRPATLVCLRDVTQLRQDEQTLARREEQLRQARTHSALGQLCAGLAHEYNNGIMALEAQLSLLQDQQPGLSDYTAPMARTLTKLLDVTRSIAAFSGDKVDQEAQTGLDELLLVARPWLQGLLGADLELVLELDAGSWRACLSDHQVERLLRALVSNAAQASVRGQVTVGTHQREGRIHLQVQDRGVGMTEEVRLHAFEPFFTTDRRRSGLGLAAVYGLVEAVGGRLELESEPGFGTVVRLELPAQEAVGPPVQAKGLQGHILLVEDEPSLRRVLALGLRKAGHTVLEAADGCEALEVWHEGIDLVLTDIRMPQMDGLELHRKVIARRPEQAFLFMSGFSDTGPPRGARLLTKPTSLTRFLEEVQIALAS